MTDTPNTDVLAARARAKAVIESVEWQMANHLPAKGETGKQCYERRLVETIAEALEEATPQSDGTAIPAGFVLVPEEATDEMADAAVRGDWDGLTSTSALRIYADMIGAAPTAPKVASDTMREADEHEDIATIAYMMGAKDERDRQAALSVQSPANAGQDGDLLEQAARVADAEATRLDAIHTDYDRPDTNRSAAWNQAMASRRIASAIRALNPTKDAQS